MDSSLPQDQSYEKTYSLAPRSRAGSSVSQTDGLFQALQIAGSPQSLALNPSRPQSSQGYISPPPSHTTYFPTPVSQARSPPLPHLTDDSLNPDWFDVDTTSEGTPYLRLEPAAEEYQQTAASSPALSTNSASMSAVAVSNFDPIFGLGSRSSFTWPVMESGSGLLGHDLSSYATDPSLSPASTARSLSPPRGLTPEQRELKRQRDLVRRDSKNSTRVRRAGSASYQSPPASIADMSNTSTPSSSSATAAGVMPVYTTAPAQMSLLTEPATTMAGPPAHLAYYSPPLSDHSQSIFSNPYQQAYLPDYQSYPAVTTPPLPSHYGRSSMPVPQDPSLMYHHMGTAPPPPPGPPPPQHHHLIGGHHHHHHAHPHAHAHAHHQQDPGASVRVVQSRPKPQCWEHGCNGRQFSTFSNLLRHQREKSGQAAKAVCPNCGAEFTRTTARNGHLQHDKCKQRRSS